MTKITTLNGFIALALLVVLALAPLQFASANTGDSDGGFFSNFRERQVNNRQNVKASLLQILSSEDVVTEPAITTTNDTYSRTNLAIATYQLTDIADRIESRMLILENQGATLSSEAYTILGLTRVKIENVTLLLATQEFTNSTVITNELASVRTDLQNIISEIKEILSK